MNDAFEQSNGSYSSPQSNGHVHPNQQQGVGRTLYEPPVYTHESVFRSENMQLSLRCPDAWVYDGVPTTDSDSASQVLDIEIPVFGANDLVGGTILLSSELTKQGKGKLSISIEGIFTYISPHLPAPTSDGTLPQPLKHEHIFFAGNMAIATYPPPVNPPLTPVRSRRQGRRPLVRNAGATREGARALNGGHSFTQRFKPLSLRNTIRNIFERRSQNEDASPLTEKEGPFFDQSDLARAQTTRTSWIPPAPIQSPEPAKVEWCSHGFSFPLPTEPPTQDVRISNMTTTTAGIVTKKLPPSFSTSHVVQVSGVRGRAYAENAEVSYRVVVEWSLLNPPIQENSRDSFEETKRSNRIEAPFLYEPIADDIDLDIPLPDGRSAITDRSRKSKRKLGHSRATSAARSVATNATRSQRHGGWNDAQTEATEPVGEPVEREWADFSMDPVYLIPGENKPPPFKAMLSLPYPCSYNRIGPHNSINFTVYFATYKVYDFLVADIRRHSEVKVELVRRVECDGRKGAVPAIVPAPDPIPINESPPPKPKSPPPPEPRQPTFLSRITMPLLRRRASAIPTEEDEEEEEEAPEIQPKYIRPEKLLPPVPSNEEGGVIIEESVIGRENFTNWFKGPEDAMRQREKRKKKKKRGRQRRSDVDPEPTASGRDHDRERHQSGNGGVDRSSTAATEQTDDRSEITSSRPRRDGDPQGFVYGKFKLDKNMIVSLCWEGLRVEYFLDVKVRYGSEVLACRAALEIYDSVED